MLQRLKKSAENVVYNYSTVVMAQFLCVPLSVFYLSLITHKFGPERFGYFTIFLATAEFFLCILANSIRHATLRFGSEDFAKGKNLKGFIRAQLLIIFFALMLILGILFLFRGYLMRVISLGERSYLWLLAYLAAYVLTDFTTWFLMAKHRIRIYVLSLLWRRISALLLFWLFFPVLGYPYSVLNLVIIEILSYLLILMIFFGYAFSPAELFFGSSIEDTRIREILNYSWPVATRFLLGYLFSWADIWVIKFFLDYRLVGQYGVVNRLLQMFTSVLMPLTMVGLPLVVSLKAISKEKVVRTFAVRIIPQISFLWSLLIILFICSSQIIFRVIFGHEYMDAVSAAQIVFVGLSFQVLSYLYTSILHAYDLTRKLLFITAVMVLLNLSLNLSLIPRLGIMGAALSKSAALIISSLLYVRVGLGRLRLKNYGLSLYAILLLPALATVVIPVKNNLFNFMMLVILSLTGIFIVKKNSVFSYKAWSFWEKVKIPRPVFHFIKRVYRLLGPGF